MKINWLMTMLAVGVIAFGVSGFGCDNGNGNNNGGEPDIIEQDGASDDDFVACVPSCDGKACDEDNGCGELCGCTDGQICENSECVDCTPSCDGKGCDEDDGCGELCGCADGEECCQDGTCAAAGECACDAQCADPLGNPYECGDDGCGGQCGICADDKVCQGHICIDAPPEQIPFGGECQYLEDCQPYLDPDTYEENPDFPYCNWDQCEGGGPCSTPFCTKSCVMHKDTVNNATGEAVGDGIEDADTPQDDCAGAFDGPVGTAFKCVALLPADQPNPVFQCQPGTTFKACVANSDCPEGEACQLAYINGVYETRCMTSVKEDYFGGIEVGKVCNGNKWEDDLAFCLSDLCFGVGCVDFCTSDLDCMTTNGATCEAGSCSNNADFVCETDTDCSAWTCDEDFELLGSDYPDSLFDLCFPKECGVSSDCSDLDYFCRFFINGEEAVEDVAWEYFCLPKPADSVAAGEACDPFWQDDIEGPECGEGFCVEGFCSGICLTDDDCAADQLCIVQEYGYDHDDDETPDKVMPYQLCQSFPGSKTECWKDSDCVEDGEACVMGEFPSDGEFMYEMQGLCANLGDQKGVMGDFCGWGVGTECKSGICFYFDQEAGYGLCTAPCTENSDCPEMVTLTDAGGSYDYKTVCALTLWGYNGDLDFDNGLFLNYCWVTDAENSHQDCSADFVCTEKDNEACLPYVHSLAPDVPATIEYKCVSNIGYDDENNPLPAPTKDVGEVCDPEANGECVGIFCMDDVQDGVGYCSQLCLTDDDCSENTQCLDNVYLPRPNLDNAGVFKVCRKAVSCLSCEDDYSCAPGYSCVNAGGGGITADYRCAPTCEIDDDCADTDGGAACVESVDAAGENEGKLACIPTDCP